MLSPAHRLTRRSEFSEVLRSGRRSGRPRLVVHVLAPPPAISEFATTSRVGLIVSKSVGGSVVRHGVARKLRHVMREILPSLPAGTLLVLRALQNSASATSTELDRDIRSALCRLGLLSPHNAA